MNNVLLVLHLFVTVALIGVVLIQRSEGGGLGIGSSQGMGAFMSGRGTANLLTRTTAILAALFMGLALALALLNRGGTTLGHSLLDDAPPAASGSTVPGPGASAGPATTSGTPPTTAGGPANPGNAPANPAAPTVPTN